MAPPKVANPRESARFYRASAKARANKKVTDTAFNAKPSQKRKRAELAEERRDRGIMGKGGKDMSHTKDGRLVAEDASRNRARNRGKK